MGAAFGLLLGYEVTLWLGFDDVLGLVVIDGKLLGNEVLEGNEVGVEDGIEVIEGRGLEAIDGVAEVRTLGIDDGNEVLDGNILGVALGLHLLLFRIFPKLLTRAFFTYGITSMRSIKSFCLVVSESPFSFL